jgi:hypothetical protein
VDLSLNLGTTFGQSDVTLGDIELTASQAGRSREGLLDEIAERFDVDAESNLVDWYDLGDSR